MVSPVSAHVLSAFHHVRDFDPWWSKVEGGRVHLATLGSRRLLIYRALSDPNAVFFCMGIPAREPFEELLRSGIVLEWFDVAGVEDVPPLFIGRDGARFYLGPHEDEEGERDVAVADIVVAAVALVSDPDAVMRLLSDDDAGLRELGVRRAAVYRALDEANEVLIVLQVETADDAVRLSEDPALLGRNLYGAGLGVYPPLFAGKLAGVVEPHRID